jgi:hypothetical protein
MVRNFTFVRFIPVKKALGVAGLFCGINDFTLLAVLLAADPEFPGSIPGAARFSAQQLVWNGVHSALVRINEELLERKSSGSSLEN